MFHLTTHSTHFIYGYMASDIWLRTILIVRKETHYRHIGYSLRLTARVLLYAPSHRQDNTYHGLCYTSRGALAGTRNSSMGPPHEGSIRRPIAPRAKTLLPRSYISLIHENKSSSLRVNRADGTHRLLMIQLNCSQGSTHSWAMCSSNLLINASNRRSSPTITFRSDRRLLASQDRNTGITTTTTVTCFVYSWSGIAFLRN